MIFSPNKTMFHSEQNVTRTRTRIRTRTRTGPRTSPWWSIRWQILQYLGLYLLAPPALENDISDIQDFVVTARCHVDLISWGSEGQGAPPTDCSDTDQRLRLLSSPADTCPLFCPAGISRLITPSSAPALPSQQTGLIVSLCCRLRERRGVGWGVGGGGGV